MEQTWNRNTLPGSSVIQESVQTTKMEEPKASEILDGYDKIDDKKEIIVQNQLETRYLEPLRTRLEKIKYYPFHGKERTQLRTQISNGAASAQYVSESATTIQTCCGLKTPLSKKELDALYKLHLDSKNSIIFKTYFENPTKESLKNLQVVLAGFKLGEVSNNIYRHWAKISSAKIKPKDESVETAQEAAQTKTYQQLVAAPDQVKVPKTKPGWSAYNDEKKAWNEAIAARRAAIRTRQAFEKTDAGKLAVSEAQKAAVKDGEKVRKNILSIKQVWEGINKCMVDFKMGPQDKRVLAKIMAREVVEKYAAGKEFEGHGKRIYLEAEYAFFNVDTNKKEMIKPPFDFWVKKTEDGIEFELFDEKLGQGGFNTVYKTRKFLIRLQDEKHAPEQMSAKTAVLRQVKNTGEQAVAIETMRVGHQLIEGKFNHKERDDLGFDLPENMDRVTEKGTVIEASGKEVFKGDYLLWHQRRSEPDKLKVLGSMAIALDALHKKNIVHCDFKPENIFVGDDGRAHLGDFDMACVTGTVSGRGSRTYKDAWTYCARKTEIADIYAMAVTVCRTTKPSTEAYRLAVEVIKANYQIAQNMTFPNMIAQYGARGEAADMLKELKIPKPAAEVIPDANTISVEEVYTQFPVYKALMTELMKFAPIPG